MSADQEITKLSHRFNLSYLKASASVNSGGKIEWSKQQNVILWCKNWDVDCEIWDEKLWDVRYFI